MTPRLAAGLLAASALAAPAHAARTKLSPYVDASQVLVAQLSGPDFGDDVVTYTAIGAGVDGTIETTRVSAGVSYRYEHQFGYGDAGDTDVHSGVGRLNVHLVRDLLDLEAGAIAARTRVDIRGFAPGLVNGDQANVTQVYGGYVGPTLATQVGALNVTALYRLGYVHADGKTDLGLADDQRRIATYDSSLSHVAAASVGMSPGELPFGWSVSGGVLAERVKELSQRFHDYFVRGDVTLPVSGTLAFTAGAGYEWLRSSSARPLIGTDGLPILDADGNLQKDRDAPRVLAYSDTGVYYDAGVIWKPSPRTTLVATVGKRYGALAVTGSFNHQLTKSSSVQVGVYNAVDSFGRSLTRQVSALPTDFTVPRSPFTQVGGGCAFSTDPRNGPGGCFDDSFQSLSIGDFRSRGVFATYSAALGATTFGASLGYAQRRYFTPVAIFGGGLGAGRVKDESVSGQVSLGFALGPSTNVQNVVFADYYRSGIEGAGDVLSGGATSSLFHSFTPRLSGTAGVGVYATDQDQFDTGVTGTLLVGARYQF